MCTNHTVKFKSTTGRATVEDLVYGGDGVIKTFRKAVNRPIPVCHIVDAGVGVSVHVCMQASTLQLGHRLFPSVNE